VETSVQFVQVAAAREIITYPAKKTVNDIGVHILGDLQPNASIKIWKNIFQSGSWCFYEVTSVPVGRAIFYAANRSGLTA